MRQLVYISKAHRLLSEAEMLELLAVSSMNNRRRGLTGLLLHHRGNYIQLLEGERDAVEKTYQRIARDTRHTGLSSLLDSEATERLCNDWKMGFRELSDESIKDMPGFSSFLYERPSFGATSDDIRTPMGLLETFRRML